jgi:CrcB protein
LNLTSVLLAGVGGFFGSILRYLLGIAAQRWSGNGFPIGTLAVNLIGCLAIGMFWGLFVHRNWFQRMETQAFVAAGILGGFTTFSAFGYETFVLLRESKYLPAVTNVAANVLAGVAAVAIGWLVARAVAS